MRRSILAALLLAGCPKSTPPVEPVPDAPSMLVVSTGADVAGADGARATITGTLERRPEGAAVVLDDGTPIWVTDGEPPAGWDWLVGTRVRVQGALWDEGGRASLKDFEPPMPADGGMMLSPP
jgi:hypothetical protein